MPRKKKGTAAQYKTANVNALNIRSYPSLDSSVVAVMREGSIVEIDKNFKNKEWDHIFSDLGEGYCMKKFLEPLVSDKPAKYSDLKKVSAEHSECDSNLVKEKKDGSKETEEN